LGNDGTQLDFRLATICIDCAESGPMVAFYSRVFGWEETHRDGDFVIMRDPRTGCHYSFDPSPSYRAPTWPEQPDGQDKQMHFEIGCEDLEAGVAFALECGARLADHQGREDLRVMLDPAGHVFCVGVNEQGF
jgi:hypothetical protein